jgi:hypothetical protein
LPLLAIASATGTGVAGTTFCGTAASGAAAPSFFEHAERPTEAATASNNQRFTAILRKKQRQDSTVEVCILAQHEKP